MAGAKPAQQDWETRYLTALPSAATYQVQGKHLKTRTSDGALAVEFASP